MQSFVDTKPQSLAELPSVEEALKAFRSHILEYRRVLNDEGIWLFLATVGCWGVTQPVYQLFAYGVTVMLFGTRVTTRYTESQSFTALAVRLEKRIQAEVESPELRTRQLLLLQQLKASALSGVRPLLATKVFLVCWVFYGASFGYALLSLPKAAA